MEREFIELLKKHRELVNKSNQFSRTKEFYKENYYAIKRGYLYEEMIAYMEKAKLFYQSKKEPTVIMQEEYELLKEVNDLLYEKFNDRNFELQQDKFERKMRKLEKKKDEEGMKALESEYSSSLSYKSELKSYFEKFTKEFEFDLKSVQIDWNHFKEERIRKYEIWRNIFLIQFQEIKDIYETYRTLNKDKEELQAEKETVEKQIKEMEALPHKHRFYIAHCYPDHHGRLIVRECLICKMQETEAEIGKNLPPIKTYSKKDRARLLEQALENEKLLKLKK